MIDIVIPFKKSINKDDELRYTLRSIELFCPEAGQIFIYGDTPRWNYKRLNVIPYYDIPGYFWKERNIANKLLQACENNLISKNFIIFHDDNFLLKPFSWWEYYHKGNLWDGRGYYAETEKNTLDLFGNHSINNFDLHAPHLVNKSKLYDALNYPSNWGTMKYGYCIKTLYGVIYNIPGTYISDYKLRIYQSGWQRYIEDRPFFSIGDFPWIEMKKDMEDIYPKKSKYEE